jgi:hypothetical protein
MNREPEDLPLISALNSIPLVQGECALISQTLNTRSPHLPSADADFFCAKFHTDGVEEEECNSPAAPQP